MRTNQYYITFLIIFSLISASCASLRAVYPDPVNIQSIIEPGDKVKIVTIDNQEAEFEVVEVTDEYIIGGNIKVPHKDITGMKEETASAGENITKITIITIGAAAGVIGGVAGVAATGAAAGALVGSAAGASGASAGVVGGGTAGAAAGAVAADGISLDEDATKWDSSCMTHLKYHPGDWLASNDIWYPRRRADLHYQEWYVTKKRGRDAREGIDIRLCFDGCHSRYNCNYEETLDKDFKSNMEDSRQKYLKGTKSCRKRFVDCRFECIEKGHPMGDIAQHIEGGYYSDGSYYATCDVIFENIHPTKDKYEKTKWQKDRDECMELTFERGAEWNPSPVKYYKQCLKDRGYSMRVY